METDKLIITNGLYEFGIFRLDTNAGRLLVGNESVKIAPKVFECLVLLVKSEGKIISKDEFFETVWTDTFVEDSSLSYTISQLRKTLAEYDSQTNYVETVPRRGYRFQSDVTKITSQNPALKDREVLLEREKIEEIWIEESFENLQSDPLLRKLPPKPGFFSTNRIVFVGLIFLLIIMAGSWVYFQNNIKSSGNPEDANFETDGYTITSFGFTVEKARSVAVQPDGKILVGGWAGENEAVSDFALVRLETNGLPDKTFGIDGKVITKIALDSDVIYDLAVQPDGKIVAVGASFEGKNKRHFCIARYKSDGSLDPTFDGDGIVLLNVGTKFADTANAVVIQPDGKIVVAGSASNLFDAKNLMLGQNDFGLIRLNSDGSLDTDFGENGRVSTHFGAGGDVGHDLILQSDGKILLAGKSTNGKNTDFAVARYNSNGTLDQNFGSNGKISTDFFGEDDAAFSLALTKDNKIILCGYAVKDTVADFAIAQYLQDGSLDTNFNETGKLTIDFDNGYDVAFGVKAQADGKILVGGQSKVKQSPEFSMASILSDGKIDRSFHQNGKISLKIKERNEAWSMSLHPHNYAILVGNSGDGKNYNFTTLRFPIE